MQFQEFFLKKYSHGKEWFVQMKNEGASLRRISPATPFVPATFATSAPTSLPTAQGSHFLSCSAARLRVGLLRVPLRSSLADSKQAASPSPPHPSRKTPTRKSRKTATRQPTDLNLDTKPRLAAAHKPQRKKRRFAVVNFQKKMKVG